MQTYSSFSAVEMDGFRLLDKIAQPDVIVYIILVPERSMLRLVMIFRINVTGTAVDKRRSAFSLVGIVFDGSFRRSQLPGLQAVIIRVYKNSVSEYLTPYFDW